MVFASSKKKSACIDSSIRDRIQLNCIAFSSLYIHHVTSFETAVDKVNRRIGEKLKQHILFSTIEQNLRRFYF